MAEKWKPKDKSIYNQWINEIITKGESLTEWEVDFITSIRKYLKFGNNPTQAQAEKLESIYANKTK